MDNKDLTPKLRKTTLGVLMLFFFGAIFALQGVGMGAVYDDFSGDTIDSTLWDTYDTGGILSQSGGFLHADGPPNYTYGFLTSTQIFNGDFEFILEYANFQTTATIFNENAPQVSLQIESLSSPGDFIYIFRGYNWGNHVFQSNGIVNGSWFRGDEDFFAPASSQSGSLKISRIGSIITTCSDEGTGWFPLGSFPGAFSGAVKIQVGAYTGDNGSFHVSCDSVEVSLTSGTIYLFVPLFSQNDSRWACDQIGSCRRWTMGLCEKKKPGGCATTSRAMVFNYYEPLFTDPGILNAVLDENEGYVGGCNMPGNSQGCSVGAPVGIRCEGFELGPLSEITGKIDACLLLGDPVIAKVRFSDRSARQRDHFVVVVGKQDNDYWINDPWDGELHSLSSGALGYYVIEKIWTYSQ